MQKEGGHRRLGMREWCMLDSSRPKTRCHSIVASVYTVLPLWKFWKSPRLLWIIPWVFWDATGQRKGSPAMRNELSANRCDTDWTVMAGRHCIWPAGQKFLHNPIGDSSRGQVVYGMEFSSKCEHGRTPYHAMNSRERGPRPSGHQLCISMHDGLRGQVCNLM